MSEPNKSNPGGTGRLVKQFEGLPNNSHAVAWSQLWEQGESELWDRGGPSPSLVDLLAKQPDMFNPMADDGRRKTALVPGCGRGYDVTLLARHGYNAYGLEVSPAAVAAGKLYAWSELEKSSSMSFSSESAEETAMHASNQGEARFFQADFFEEDWAGRDAPSHYDLVYDYTFFCAIPPDMRQKWGKRMADIIRPGGLLVCLEFPLYKDPSIQGPPWGVGGGVYWDTLVRGGTGILNAPIPQELQDSQCSDGNGNFVRTLFIKPERFHAAAKGTDMLSVWSRK